MREFLAPHHRWFHLHYHPPYHPELNPQERIWRRIRYEETTNHYYASPEDLERGVLNKVARRANASKHPEIPMFPETDLWKRWDSQG